MHLLLITIKTLILVTEKITHPLKFDDMKKKILLTTLFCVVLALAIVGLTTEKTMALNWAGGDDPFWAETGESLGMPTPTTVYCNETIIKETGYWEPGHTHTEWITMSIQKTAINCASISTGSCTPSNPC